jgi:integrase
MLTALAIEKLKPTEKRREIPDGRVSGLFLIQQPTGAMSWGVRYRFDGKPTKFTIGPFPAIDLATARRRAQEALGEVAAGMDPAARKKSAKEARKAEASTADRVDSVASAFLDKYVKRNVGGSWANESERLLRVEILPVLGKRRLSELKRTDVHDLLDGIVDRGAPIIANRTLAVLRKLCNWAIERGIIAVSPCDKVKSPAPEQSRDRVLDGQEIRAVWAAFEAIGWPFGHIGQLALLTAARRDELASARWSEIDLSSKTWTIAKERTKNGIAHEIPLSDAAVQIFQGLPRIGDKKDAFIFSTTGSTPVSGFSRAKAAIDSAMLQAMRKDAETRGDEPASVGSARPWVFHDLRRTSASGMASLGIAPHVVEAVLNHKSGMIKGVAAVYNRYSYATEKRHALDAWARRLAAIINGDTEPRIPAFVPR